MARYWYFNTQGHSVGPVDAGTIKEKSAAGIIGPDTRIRAGDDGQWVPASRVKGLTFGEPEATPQSAPVVPVGLPAHAVSSQLIPCPDCGHSVSKNAAACPSCGCLRVGYVSDSTIEPSLSGSLMIVFGLLGAAFFAFVYDSSYLGTHNLGLIAGKICGTLFFVGLTVAGTASRRLTAKRRKV